MKIVVTLIVAFLVIAGFGFFVAGGFERFQEPIQIVVPSGYKGIVCAQLLPDAGGPGREQYVVDEAGRTAIEGDVLRSHRQRQWLTRAQGGRTTPIENSSVTAVRTENDSRTGHTYMVYWVGPEAEWKKFAESASSFCMPKQG